MAGTREFPRAIDADTVCLLAALNGLILAPERAAELVARGDRRDVRRLGGDVALSVEVVAPAEDLAVHVHGDRVPVARSDGADRAHARGDVALTPEVPAP